MMVRLRRYPNRRYYDAARSQHLTLEEIFQLICDGQQVRINDSKSGEDITVRVLAQLILEQAPSKLAALPAELLHQIIRSNESLLREFIDKYFYRALTAFIESQRDFDRYLRLVLGLPHAAPSAPSVLPGQNLAFPVPNWMAMMMGPFAQALLAGAAATPIAPPSAGYGDEASDLRKTVDELRQEVDALRKEFRNGRNGLATGSEPLDAGS